MMPGNTTGNHIFLIDFDTSLNQIGNPIQLTFDTDIPSGKSITDHKHLFVNNELYVSFSLTQDEDLYLFKTDNYGNRIGNMVTVVSAQPDPTNDMILFISDSLLHILFFRPISQHNVYTYDLNLNFQQNQVTSPALPHNNIGEALYIQPFYYMFTGSEFGHNSNLILTKWNTDWTPAISNPQNIVSSLNGDGNWFSTGLIYDTINNLWIIAAQHIEQSTAIDDEHIDFISHFWCDSKIAGEYDNEPTPDKYLEPEIFFTEASKRLTDGFRQVLRDASYKVFIKDKISVSYEDDENISINCIKIATKQLLNPKCIKIFII